MSRHPLWCGKCAGTTPELRVLCPTCFPKNNTVLVTGRVAGEGESPVTSSTSVKSATPTDRESTEAGHGEPRTLSGGRGANLPAAPSDQLTLNLSPMVEPNYAPGMSIDDRAAAFHEANPHVMEACAELTREFLASGRTKWSINGLFERLRWFYDMETTGDCGYRLNNTLRSRYSRMLMDLYPEFEGVFATRELRAA